MLPGPPHPTPHTFMPGLPPELTSAGTSPLCRPLCHSGPASGPSLSRLGACAPAASQCGRRKSPAWRCGGLRLSRRTCGGHDGPGPTRRCHSARQGEQRLRARARDDPFKVTKGPKMFRQLNPIDLNLYWSSYLFFFPLNFKAGI